VRPVEGGGLGFPLDCDAYMTPLQMAIAMAEKDQLQLIPESEMADSRPAGIASAKGGGRGVRQIKSFKDLTSILKKNTGDEGGAEGEA